MYLKLSVSSLIFLIMVLALVGCQKKLEPLALPNTLIENTTVDNNFDNKHNDTSNDEVLAQDKKINISRRIENPTSLVNDGSIDYPITENYPKFDSKLVFFSAENLPLPQFINEVFGNILQLNFKLNDDIKKRTDLVTLRIPRKRDKTTIYKLARNILKDYGIKVKYTEELLKFDIGSSKDSSVPPLLISGRALPEVPNSHRIIFQYVPMRVVNQANMRHWLLQSYQSLGLGIDSDISRNALILKGPRKIVKQALKTLALFDQPNYKGKHGARFELINQTPEKVKNSLETILKTEGYTLGQTGSTNILSLPYLNSLLVLTVDQSILNYIEQWIKKLDQIPIHQKQKNGIFYYEVRNTRADTLVTSLRELFVAPPAVNKNPDNPTTATGNRIILDQTRNAILFQGATDEWKTIKEVLKKMDRPAKQILAEVTIAEVTLTDQENFGIEWLIRTSSAGVNSFLSNTASGLGFAIGGTNYALDNAGQTHAVLNALASNQRVSILSTPRLLVKSGEEASIDVGSEVPVVTTETNAPTQTDGSSNLLRQVQYRKTGVLLNITPVIHSGNRVDLKISQEVSEAQANTTSTISSPSIFTRKVNTSVTLKDGGSVMLAGLITRSSNTGESGIPILKDMPVVGDLFKSKQYQTERKEMLILIRPYIIENDEDAYSLTQAQQNQLTIFDTPIADHSLSTTPYSYQEEAIVTPYESVEIIEAETIPSDGKI